MGPGSALLRASVVLRITPRYLRILPAAWNTWGGSVMDEIDHSVTQMDVYGSSLTEALQPKHRENGTAARAYI